MDNASASEAGNLGSIPNGGSYNGLPTIAPQRSITEAKATGEINSVTPYKTVIYSVTTTTYIGSGREVV